MSEAVKLIEELAALSKRPDFLGGGKAIGESLHLAKKLGLALQKPEDAAIELCFQVGLLADIQDWWQRRIQDRRF